MPLASVTPWPDGMMAACAILLLTGAFALTVPPMELVARPEIQSTAGHLEAYFDETLTRSIDDVVHGNLLQPHAGSSYSRPLRKGATWMRLRLHNPLAQTLTRVVRIHNSLIDELDSRQEDATGALVHGEAGEGIDVEQRPVPTRCPTFQLEVPPEQTRTLYLRLRSAGSMSCIITVAPLPVYEHQESIRQLVTGMLWGMFGLVTLYCGYFFIRFWEALYGWLALTTLCLQVLVAFYFWAEASYWFPATIRVAVSDPIIHISVIAMLCEPGGVPAGAAPVARLAAARGSPAAWLPGGLCSGIAGVSVDEQRDAHPDHQCAARHHADSNGRLRLARSEKGPSGHHYLRFYRNTARGNGPHAHS